MLLNMRIEGASSTEPCFIVTGRARYSIQSVNTGRLNTSAPISKICSSECCRWGALYALESLEAAWLYIRILPLWNVRLAKMLDAEALGVDETVGESMAGADGA